MTEVSCSEAEEACPNCSAIYKPSKKDLTSYINIVYYAVNEWTCDLETTWWSVAVSASYLSRREPKMCFAFILLIKFLLYSHYLTSFQKWLVHFFVIILKLFKFLLLVVETFSGIWIECVGVVSSIEIDVWKTISNAKNGFNKNLWHSMQGTLFTSIN